MAFYSTIVTVFGLLAVVAVLSGIALGGALLLAGPRARLRDTFSGLERHPIAWAGGVSLLAMLGSLYFSEIAHFLPCSLCWYQRIAMYPLVVVLGVGLTRGDLGVWRYGLPLSLIGLGIAVYHVVIQWMPTLDLGVCTSGAPCSGRYVAAFGVVSIPTMAAAAFLLITSLLLLLRILERNAPLRQPKEG